MSLTEVQLCNHDEVPDPGSKGFIVTVNEQEVRLFIVKSKHNVYAYINSCPHTLGPLDWMPDNFLDEDKKYIMCANHGAMFQIEDGFCIYGPCKSQSLKQLECIIKDNKIVVLI